VRNLSEGVEKYPSAKSYARSGENAKKNRSAEKSHTRNLLLGLILELTKKVKKSQRPFNLPPFNLPQRPFNLPPDP
jgi:hypothetical protein